MYFKIIKKTGERAIEFVESVRSYELCQVHPHWEWYTNDDGVLVNYFVYTSLRNLDLYVECDKEFVDTYNSKYVANYLINFVNDAIAAFSGMGYKHIMNLDEACRRLNVVPFKMSQSKMIKYVELFKHWYDNRHTYAFNIQEEWLKRKHGVTLHVEEFESRDTVSKLSQCWLALNDGGCIKYTYRTFHRKEIITDEATIKHYEETHAAVTKLKEELKAMVEKDENGKKGKTKKSETNKLIGREKHKKSNEINKLEITISNIHKDNIVIDGKTVVEYSKTVPDSSTIAEYYTPERFSHTTMARVMGVIPFNSPIKIEDQSKLVGDWVNITDKVDHLHALDNQTENVSHVDDNIVLG